MKNILLLLLVVSMLTTCGVRRKLTLPKDEAPKSEQQQDKSLPNNGSNVNQVVPPPSNGVLPADKNQDSSPALQQNLELPAKKPAQ